MSLVWMILIVTAVAVVLGLWAWWIQETDPGGDPELEDHERDRVDRLAVGREEWLP